MIGKTLGPYQVVAKLGEGGMGEVYRATDSQLKRSVALKVLPAAVATDAERLARFQREAEVLAALNHPNIAAIYGLERSLDSTSCRHNRAYNVFRHERQRLVRQRLGLSSRHSCTLGANAFAGTRLV